MKKLFFITTLILVLSFISCANEDDIVYTNAGESTVTNTDTYAGIEPEAELTAETLTNNEENGETKIGARNTRHHIGINFGPHLHMDDLDYLGVSTSFDVGYTVGMNYHYKLNRLFSVGSLVEYTTFSVNTINTYIGATAMKFDGDFSTVITALTATLHHDIENTTVYLTLGAGAAFNTLDRELTVNLNKTTTSEDETTLAFIAEIGSRYHLTQAFDVGMSVRYIHNDTTFDDIDAKMGGLSVRANVGFNF